MGKNLPLTILSVVITFAILEILANVLLWHFASPEQFQRFASVNQLRRRFGERYYLAEQVAVSPHRYLGYYPTPDFHNDNGDRHNALGYRGEEISVPKPPGTYRIAALGGSTTYGVAVPMYEEAYPYQLQRYLREADYSGVEVVNAGVSGYSSWESLINLSFRVLDLEPDMIIVYHGINDVHPRFVWPSSAYQGDNSGSLRSNLRPIRMPPIWQYSTALRTLAVTAGWIKPHSSLDLHFNEPRPDTYYREEFRQQYTQGVYPDGIFGDVSAMTMLEKNPPDYFERNLQNMVAIAEANGVEVVLVTFAYSPLFPDPEVASPEYQLAYAQMNEIVLELADTNGVHAYDLAAVMPTDERYYADGRHFSEEGNALRAKLIGDFLLENDLLAEVE